MCPQDRNSEHSYLARVLVLDGHSAAALAITRSLGRAGYYVAVGCGSNIFAATPLSRYCKLALAYTDPTKDVRGFASTLLDAVKRYRIDLVIPATDWTLTPVARYRQQLGSLCRVALPNDNALELVADKYRTIELAQSLGIPVPKTGLIRDLNDLDHSPELVFPVVVKDRASARWNENDAVLGSVTYAYDSDDLQRQITRRLQSVPDAMIQEFVGGVGIGFSCFAHKGQVFAPFQWERIRETDPRGSGSSARKSVPLHPEILKFSSKLVEATGFEGIMMVEFKYDRQANRMMLMEINGRPWGSLQLPVFSGIDYPRFLAEWYLTESLPPRDIDYKTGILCRRIVGELTHLENLHRGKPAGWPGTYPSFWTGLARIMIPWWPGMRYDDLWFSDPRPGLAGLGNWFSQRVRKQT